MSQTTENPTNSAQEAVQKPPTKVFDLVVGVTYNISVEAESAGQALEAWEADKFEYTANFEPDYIWNEEEILGLHDSNQAVEEAEIDYNRVRESLGLESLED
jgi:hypothetical protein